VSLVAFQAVALFVWSRRKRLLLGCAALYLLLFLGSELFTAEQTRPYRETVLTLLRFAPFVLPLLLFVNSSDVATIDLLSPRSFFSRHFFTLPLKVHQAVLPFMLYAIALAAVLWFLAGVISDGLALSAGPLDAPAHARRQQPWFPFLVASLLAWLQALLWTPTRWRGIRVPGLLGLLAFYFWLLVMGASETWSSELMTAISLAQFPIAFAIGVRGVARERRGDSEKIVKEAASASVPGNVKVRPLRQFKSALHAQTWYEQNLHRWKGKTAVILLMPIALGVLALIGQLLGVEPNNREALIALTQSVIALMLVSVQLVAFGVGLTCASFHNRVNWFTQDSFAMPGFFAAVPMRTGDFVWAKLTSAARSMVWVCGITLAGCAMMALYAGVFGQWSIQLARVAADHGELARVVLPMLAIVSFVLVTLLVTASACWLALFGRAWNWINGGIAVLGVAFLIGLAGAKVAAERYPGFFAALPTITQFLAAVKLIALGILIDQVRRRGHFSAPRILFVCGGWLAAVTAATAVVVWLGEPGEYAVFTTLCVAIVLVPVCGVLAAPLALQLNRSR
jgi:hypothetical protein